ncbi:hypothetical protein Ttaiw_00452 [Tepidimonas taiwanensis]|uniref:Flagellar protein FliT n=1 Tax=Tepidimonas taiwanensis TaxID=307486 RepID=A0A554XCH7_9BURK|nr:hypothetical protein [Tepidimonas taiwanensis]TSE33526.1 hypothetical protein Ttaiw_00452 [Tepidimonas taiwanensis]
MAHGVAPAPNTDGLDKLRHLRDRLDEALNLTTRHAAGEIDADGWLAGIAELAHAFTAVRAQLPAVGQAPARTAEVNRLLDEIGQRLRLLAELQGRLSASARLALGQMLPQDDLNAYASLGRQRLPGRRGGYG